jgi:hypothetical protein
VTISSTKRCFILVAWRYSELIIRICKVKASIILSTLETIKELGHEGEGITILYGDLVKLAIIDAKAKRAVRLLDEEDRGTKRRFGRTDKALGDHSIDVIFEGLEFRFRHAVNGTKNGLGVGDEGNFMVDPRTMRRKFLGIFCFEDIGELSIFDGDGGRGIV